MVARILDLTVMSFGLVCFGPMPQARMVDKGSSRFAQNKVKKATAAPTSEKQTSTRALKLGVLYA